jgi:hypothetical protein
MPFVHATTAHLLLAGYAVCALFGLFMTYAAHIARAICETPGYGKEPTGDSGYLR